MKQQIILLLFLSLSINVFGKIVMTKNEWVSKLQTLAKQKSAYSQEWGKNTLLWDGSKWWCDCSNLMKALFNGRDINDKTVGKFQRDLSNTGDVNANGLIKKCSSISTNFKSLKAGEPRLLHMDGHMGAYIGKEVNTDHGVCNVIECTAAWNGGIKYSYVDSSGRRLYGKNGAQKGTWTSHGLPSSWVKY